LSFYFFFFQAEDGIRDFHVTGVQTCALPISIDIIPSVTIKGAIRPKVTSKPLIRPISPPKMMAAGIASDTGSPADVSPSPRTMRSEERRVGKQRRTRGRLWQ